MGFLSRIANSEEEIVRHDEVPIAFAREHKKCRRSALYLLMWPFVKEHSSEETLPKTCSDSHLLSQFSERNNSSTCLVTQCPPSDVGITDATQTMAENASLKTKWNLSAPALNFYTERGTGKQNTSDALSLAEEEIECAVYTDETSSYTHSETVISMPEQEKNEPFHETCLNVSSLSTDAHTTLLSTTVPALQQNPLEEEHPVDVSYVMKVDCDESGTVHTSAVAVESNDKKNSKDSRGECEEDVSSPGGSYRAYLMRRRRDRNAAKAKRFWRIVTYAFTIYGICLLVLGTVFLVIASTGDKPTNPLKDNRGSFYFGQ